jgi:hypothetical protein
MKRFIASIILIKLGFLLGILATLKLTKSKLMIDIGVEKDEDFENMEEEIENEPAEN